MANKKKYTAEELIERQKEAKKRWKQKNKERTNTLQNGANGNQTECREAKRFIRSLMNGRCECCGMKDYNKTVGHHIIPVGEDMSSDSPRNIMCVCRMCHSMLHKMIRNDREMYDEFVMMIMAKREPYKRMSIEKYEEVREDGEQSI